MVYTLKTGSRESVTNIFLLIPNKKLYNYISENLLFTGTVCVNVSVR